MSMRISSSMLNRQLVNDVLKQQNEIAAVQTGIASGKRINSPKDDPAQAGRLLDLEEADARLVQFNRNANAAEAQLNLEETVLTGVNDSLLRIRDLALSANNATMDSQARSAVEAEITQRLDELYDLANVKDSNGDHLFSGTNTSSSPFTRGGPTVYNGNDESRKLPIGLGATIQSGDSGADVFVRIKEGNGTFSVNADGANGGTGIISIGDVTDPAAYSGTPYTIEFTSPTTFDIVDTSTSTIVQSGAPYNAGETISFNGTEINIRGNPAVGDKFELLPARFKDLFSIVSDFADTLGAPVNNANDKAIQTQNIDNVIVNLDQALEHINALRSRIGTRLTSIDSRRDENDAVTLQLQRTRADIEDLDIAQAVTDLQSRISSLEILQKSYSRIQDLSLFNYL